MRTWKQAGWDFCRRGGLTNMSLIVSNMVLAHHVLFVKSDEEKLIHERISKLEVDMAFLMTPDRNSERETRAPVKFMKICENIDCSALLIASLKDHYKYVVSEQKKKHLLSKDPSSCQSTTSSVTEHGTSHATKAGDGLCSLLETPRPITIVMKDAWANSYAWEFAIVRRLGVSKFWHDIGHWSDVSVLSALIQSASSQVFDKQYIGSIDVETLLCLL